MIVYTPGLSYQDTPARRGGGGGDGAKNLSQDFTFGRPKWAIIEGHHLF